MNHNVAEVTTAIPNSVLKGLPVVSPQFHDTAGEFRGWGLGCDRIDLGRMQCARTGD
jgi:hypothetical protein